MKLARKHNGNGSESGVAIIVVILAVGLAWTIALLFARSNIIGSYTAAANEDRLRAEMLARSTMNLAEASLRIQTRLIDGSQTVQGMIGTDNVLDYSQQLMCLFSASIDEKELSEGEIGIKGLMASTGDMTVEVKAEDGKINLNCAAGSKEDREVLQQQLSFLFAHRAYDELFQNPDATGWRRDRNEQVRAIIDFIDPDAEQYGTVGGGEQYGYGQLDEPYTAHNNKLDSIEEIRLIRGVDDKFWALFGDEFTIYGDCKVNVGAVSDIKIIAGLIQASAQNPQDPILLDQVLFWRLVGAVHEVMGFPQSSRTLKDFASTVKDPYGLAAMEALGASAGQILQETGAQPVQGIGLNLAKLRKVATEGPRRIYRVSGEARVPTYPIYNEGQKVGWHTVTRRVVGVWDTKLRNDNRHSAMAPTGGWIYWHEE